MRTGRREPEGGEEAPPSSTADGEVDEEEEPEAAPEADEGALKAEEGALKADEGALEADVQAPTLTIKLVGAAGALREEEDTVAAEVEEMVVAAVTAGEEVVVVGLPDEGCGFASELSASRAGGN